MQPSQIRHGPGARERAEVANHKHRAIYSTPGLRSDYGDPVELFRAAHGGKFTVSGNGWRGRCLACDDNKAALSVAANGDRLLLYCFKSGCRSEDILAAVGLRWSDVQPPRIWPESPEERRRACRAIRECGWSAALSVLAVEATVLHLAALTLSKGTALSSGDHNRLALANTRIDRAALVLIERDAWRPDDTYPPAKLVTLKRAALTELQRQVAAAEADLARAEAGAV